jgi:hypothetical protein
MTRTSEQPSTRTGGDILRERNVEDAGIYECLLEAVFEDEYVASESYGPIPVSQAELDRVTYLVGAADRSCLIELVCRLMRSRKSTVQA